MVDRSEKSTDVGDRISVSFLIAGGYAIKALADAKKFNKFLKEKSISKRGLLRGMKLIFENIMEDQMLQIQIEAGFDFTDDRVIQRALYKGIPVEQVKSNSELARILRGLGKLISRVTSENNVPDFQVTLAEETLPWVEAIENLYRRYSHSELSKRKSFVRDLLSFSWNLRFLDIQQNVRGALRDRMTMIKFSMNEKISKPISPEIEKQRIEWEKAFEKQREKFDTYFQGWKIATSYLWWYIKRAGLPEPPIDLILQCVSWEELDNLFRMVADGVVKEADDILETHSGDVFEVNSKYRPRNIKSLMVDYDISLENDRNLNLDHLFLWYDFEILDGASSKIFSGTSTFNSLLLGTVRLKEWYKRKDAIEVRRIMHPAGFHTYRRGELEEQRAIHDVGYAILIPSFSTMADYSGWIVSLECCNDYSGFAGGMRVYTEHLIKMYEEHINIEDLVISREELRQYFKEKIKERLEERSFSRLSESEWNSIHLQESVELGVEMSSVLMELFVAIDMSELGYDVSWQFRDSSIIGDREIDILALKDNQVQIIECSRHLPINTQGTTRIINEMKRKKKLIENSEYNRAEITLQYVTSKDLSTKRFNQAADTFRKEGIHVTSIHEILQRSHHGTKSLLELFGKIYSSGPEYF